MDLIDGWKQTRRKVEAEARRERAKEHLLQRRRDTRRASIRYMARLLAGGDRANQKKMAEDLEYAQRAGPRAVFKFMLSINCTSKNNCTY